MTTIALPRATRGAVHLVGAGPGDPGLLTLRAARLLETADLVAYDRLAPREALTLCPTRTERIEVGKRCGGPGWTQDEINHLLVTEAAAGKAVVRLKGGDPFLFGRGGEEALACVAAGVPVHVVPGVTSAISAPAAAGIPVTHRGLAAGVAIVTGHEDPTKPATQIDWDALARFPGTLVILMGLGRLRPNAEALLAAGRPADTPAAVVSSGATTRQHTVVGSLRSIADVVDEAGIRSPAAVVIGEVAGLHAHLGPLFDAAAGSGTFGHPLETALHNTV